MAHQSEAQWKSFEVNDQKFKFVSLKKRAVQKDWLDEKTDFIKNTAYLDWPNLPRLFLTNARSINNKRNDLSELIKTDDDVQDCDIILITETWLNEGTSDIYDSNFTLMLRADRDEEKTGKERGGGQKL